jgi:hypothetical protein
MSVGTELEWLVEIPDSGIGTVDLVMMNEYVGDRQLVENDRLGYEWKGWMGGEVLSRSKKNNDDQQGNHENKKGSLE